MEVNWEMRKYGASEVYEKGGHYAGGVPIIEGESIHMLLGNDDTSVMTVRKEKATREEIRTPFLRPGLWTVGIKIRSLSSC